MPEDVQKGSRSVGLVQLSQRLICRAYVQKADSMPGNSNGEPHCRAPGPQMRACMSEAPKRVQNDVIQMPPPVPAATSVSQAAHFRKPQKTVAPELLRTSNPKPQTHPKSLRLTAAFRAPWSFAVGPRATEGSATVGSGPWVLAICRHCKRKFRGAPGHDLCEGLRCSAV